MGVTGGLGMLDFPAVEADPPPPTSATPPPTSPAPPVPPTLPPPAPAAEAEGILEVGVAGSGVTTGGSLVARREAGALAGVDTWPAALKVL